MPCTLRGQIFALRSVQDTHRVIELYLYMTHFYTPFGYHVAKHINAPPLRKCFLAELLSTLTVLYHICSSKMHRYLLLNLQPLLGVILPGASSCLCKSTRVHLT